MIDNKYITKVVAVLMTIAVAVCLLATMFGEKIIPVMGDLNVSMEYESKLFQTDDVLEINILMDDADWQSMMDNAIREEYVQCDVEIGDEVFYRVGIRPKGNTSLSTIVADPNTDRYSFKLEFDRFVDGQTCYGLDKLILNNNYADATYMKEALIYDMFQELGADASLYNFAKVSVNGEYWGLYLALEAVEDSFMLRNYGTANGELYKPDSMNMGGGKFGDMSDRKNMPNTEDMPKMEDMPDMKDMPKMEDMGFEKFRPQEEQDFERKGGPGGMMGGNGGDLTYSDDDPDSYSTIWDGEVTNTGETDHQRVVKALKNISEGVDLETYMDIDNLVKYMAVHIFSENADSLSGSMSHNYYLYENNGQLNLLPWDYNLAFGGMGNMGRGRGEDSSGATDTVNGAIDDAWNGTEFFDTLLAEEEYKEAYYSSMEQVVSYIQDGKFEEFYTNTRNKIDRLVEDDPTAFYSYEEYLTATETLYEVVILRGQSIAGQLAGTIPSTDAEQRSSDTLIDASHLDLSVMGSMSMGGGDFGGNPFEGGDFGGDKPPMDFKPKF